MGREGELHGAWTSQEVVLSSDEDFAQTLQIGLERPELGELPEARGQILRHPSEGRVVRRGPGADDVKRRPVGGIDSARRAAEGRTYHRAWTERRL